MLEIDSRKEYNPKHSSDKQVLTVEGTPSSPIDLFKEWYREAEKNDPNGEIYAMTLSTVGTDGQPRSRIVLMREFSDEGLIFYTNYESGKGKEIAKNPRVALNFHWSSIDCQVRIEGWTEKVSTEKSDRYFNTRPEASRISAAVSKQSQVLASRKKLIDEITQYQNPPPRPPHWGGYLIRPIFFEFWLGKKSRMHERLIYQNQLTDPLSSDAKNIKLTKEWKKYLLYP